MADDGPAVIGALLDQIEFVAAARAVLGLPDLAVIVEGQAFLAATADGPDLGTGAVLADEGIARRRLAVGGDAQDLAQMGVEGLRHQPGIGAAGVAVADGDIEIAVLAHHHAAAAARADAGAVVVGRLGAGLEDHLHVAEGVGGLVEVARATWMPLIMPRSKPKKVK